MSDNVIQFPGLWKGEGKGVKPISSSNTAEQLDYRSEYNMSESLEPDVHDMTDWMIEVLMQNCISAGIDVANPDRIKDFALVVESMKSYINRVYEHPHPLQDFSQKVFHLSDAGVIFLNLNILKKVKSKPKNDHH